MIGKRFTGGVEVPGGEYTMLAGIGIAVAALVGGFVLEHGSIGDLGSLSSALIVIGGTLGAVALGTPDSAVVSAFRRCRGMFKRNVVATRTEADLIVRFAVMMRRAGTAAIEPDVEAMPPGFLRRALMLVLDGVSPQEVRHQLQNDIGAEEEIAEADARVFEQAGGYAPTIGIIGAVLGLIQVMKKLGNVDAVGQGIAAAFISTLYGVALANLLLLPVAARIRLGAQADRQSRQLLLEGVTAIAEGLSLQVVRSRLGILRSAGSGTPQAPVTPTVFGQYGARKSA